MFWWGSLDQIQTLRMFGGLAWCDDSLHGHLQRQRLVDATGRIRRQDNSRQVPFAIDSVGEVWTATSQAETARIV